MARTHEMIEFPLIIVFHSLIMDWRYEYHFFMLLDSISSYYFIHTNFVLSLIQINFNSCCYRHFGKSLVTFLASRLLDDPGSYILAESAALFKFFAEIIIYYYHKIFNVAQLACANTKIVGLLTLHHMSVCALSGRQP